MGSEMCIRDRYESGNSIITFDPTCAHINEQGDLGTLSPLLKHSVQTVDIKCILAGNAESNMEHLKIILTAGLVFPNVEVLKILLTRDITLQAG